MWRLALLVTLGLLLCGAAVAQTAKPERKAQESYRSGWMTADEMRAELFGVDMRGVTQPGGTPWRECIGLDERTLYQFPGRPDAHGQMWVTHAGEACFSYETGGGGCFRALRQGKGYLFTGVSGGTVFAATDIRRGIQTCIAEDLVG